MEKTIVVLLILLIIFSLIRVVRVSKTGTKEQSIKFYTQELEKVKTNNSSDSVKLFASLIVFAIDVAIIYFSIQSILSFIK